MPNLLASKVSTHPLNTRATRVPVSTVLTVGILDTILRIPRSKFGQPQTSQSSGKEFRFSSLTCISTLNILKSKSSPCFLNFLIPLQTSLIQGRLKYESDSIFSTLVVW